MSNWPAGLFRIVALAVTSTIVLAGCRTGVDSCESDGLAAYQSDYHHAYMPIEFPAADVKARVDVAQTIAPCSYRGDQEPEYWSLTLDEAIQHALANSEVIRNIGGRILNAPGQTTTVHDTAIQDTNPRSGIEAALSDFDTQFVTSSLLGRSQQTINNIFTGGGTNDLLRNGGNLTFEVNKYTARGGQLAFRHISNYDRNNSPDNLFESVFITGLEAELRQPLLRGAGLEFNQIAGPQSLRGNYNGIQIARINTDVSLADFEGSIVGLVRDVERLYWRLHFAYRNLDARKAHRDANLQIWQLVKGICDAGEGDAEREALARAAFYNTQELVQNALTGVDNSPESGVYATERRLRFLLGLPASDGRLIHPADEPIRAGVQFDWEDSLQQALVRRVELRKHQQEIKRRTLELIAARNFGRVKLDFVGRYRWTGFGDNLFGNDGTPRNSAFESLATDGLENWQFGLELSAPIGNRIGRATVRNAEVRLAREQAIYRDMELKVSHDLAASFSELDRAYLVAQSRHDRAEAFRLQIELIRVKYDNGAVPLEFLLTAQRNATESASQYHRALVDYNLAISDLHLARGSLLELNNLQLTEGPWTTAPQTSPRLNLPAPESIPVPEPVRTADE